MNTRLCIAALFPLMLFSCRSVGVEITDAQEAEAIGTTELDLREAYGVPHVYAIDSDGVETLSYGLEERRFLGVHSASYVEFTLVNDRVTKTRRVGSRPVAYKDRAH